MRIENEEGQGLVEYALILALVSIAAIAALGFLSGEIQDVFRRTGNVLNTAQAAGGGGAPGPTPPADFTAAASFPTTSNVSGQWFNGNGAVNNPQGFNGAPTAASGLYSTAAGLSGTCSFTAANGYTFTGTWHPTGGEPSNWEWNVPGDGVTGGLYSACYGTLGGPGGGEPPTSPPANGTPAGSFSPSSNASGIWWNGNLGAMDPDGHGGAPNGVSGLYSTTDGLTGSCSITASNGFVMAGSWHPSGGESAGWNWTLSGDGSLYLSACY